MSRSVLKIVVTNHSVSLIDVCVFVLSLQNKLLHNCAVRANKPHPTPAIVCNCYHC